MNDTPDGTITINATTRMLAGYFRYRGFQATVREMPDCGMHVLDIRRPVGERVIAVQWAISHLDIAAMPADRFFELADTYLAQLFQAMAAPDQLVSPLDPRAHIAIRNAKAGKLWHWYVESLPDGFGRKRKEYEGYNFEEMLRTLATVCLEQTMDKIWIYRDGEQYRLLELR